MSTKRDGDRPHASGRRIGRGGATRSKPARDAAGWERVWRELRRQGLVTGARPVKPLPENPRFRPIRVRGEPISETLIRERGARLEPDTIAAALAAVRRGEFQATSGYFGAAGIVSDARARFRAPSRSGRATDPTWTEQRLMRLAPSTLARLERMARRLGTQAGVRIGAMQLAALLIERAIAGMPER